ncbi:MAG TPA: HYExAFE family protein [Phycisphaerae bacterium]|nr:HYExAFE family protein [Phycisphaerae bacterium]
MAHRSVHYEAAFEDYLRAKGLPYVAVDEAKKALFAGAAIKSFDFLVYSSTGPNLLADVKGRKFPDSVPGRKRGASRAWENWVTRQDIEGLLEWEKVFGTDFRAVLVFAYWLQGPPQRAPFGDVHLFREKHYAFVAIRMADYLTAARPRSAKWQTVTMPSAEFARQAADVASFL